MPKTTTLKAFKKPITSPTMLRTPMKRRLRSRAAAPVIKTLTLNGTDSEDHSDDDFEVKKMKSKPKPTKFKRVKQKKTVTSFRSVAETEFEESSQSQYESDCSKATTNTLDSQFEYKKKEIDLDNIEEPITRKKIENAISAKNVTPEENRNSSGPSVTDVNSSQSSSEEFKTPTKNDSYTDKILADIKDRSNFPDIVEEMRAGNVKYITKNVEHQKLELAERKKLLEIRKEMDEYIRKFRKEHLTKTLAMSKAFGNMLVCDVLENLKHPTTLAEMATKIPQLDINGNSSKGVGLSAISEDSESVDFYGSEEEEVGKDPRKKVPVFSFPRPKQTTPLHVPMPGRVFTFAGSDEPTVHPSASKLARLAKPGEIYYSERGSPIVPPILGKSGSTSQAHYNYPKSAHTVEVTDVDGEKIKVDLVLAGGAVEKSRLFNEFVTDVRGIAATRSTVKHNRIQPARVPTKNRKGVSTSTVASVASKKRR